MRLKIGIVIAKILSFLSIILHRGRGQVIGGHALLFICPQALNLLTKNKQVILISSTNGKSTTTKFINTLFTSNNLATASNATGANMPAGIAFSLATATKKDFKYAILEVDEPFLPALISQIDNVETIVISNLSRDQLDRGSEVKMIADKWQSAFDNMSQNVQIIANADDPFIVYCCQNHKNTAYLGLTQNWNLDSALCPNCGQPLKRKNHNWKCSDCTLQQPPTVASVTNNNTLMIGSKKYTINLQLPGIFNTANALAALWTYDSSTNNSSKVINHNIKLLEVVNDVDGRYLEAEYNSYNLQLFLGKNPASWSELINCLDNSTNNLIIVLNSYAADGRDPSWIYDVPFENLALKHNNLSVWVAGTRKYDMAMRLQIAGLDIIGTTTDPLQGVETFTADKNIKIIANYTAFQDLRRRLVK